MTLRASKLGKCKSCNKDFPQFVATQLYCSRACSTTNGTTDIERKAKSLSSSIRFGKGRKEFFEQIIRNALHTPCPYCKALLTIETMSLDHKEPVMGNKNRMLYEVNTPDNLHIVCRDCNTMKGDMSHTEYLALCAFLEDKPGLASKIRRRLGRSNILWGMTRKH